MPTARQWAIAGVLVVLAGGPAWAFGTIHGLGQNAEHEQITRKGLASFALGPRTLDELAGKRGSFGAVGAPDRPDRGLMSVSAAHCDNGDWLDTPGYPRSKGEANAVLESCRAYVFVSLDEAVTKSAALVAQNLAIREGETALGCRFNGRAAGAKCAVLEQLGMAFHASQDFYSHSNWLDPLRRPGLRIEDPPGMGQASPADWLDEAQSREQVPDGLITGCYEGFPESRHCAGRVKHATLNKDGKGSPRGKGGIYTLAMDVAAEDTRARWAWFEQRLIETYGMERGSRIACVVKSDDPKVCRV